MVYLELVLTVNLVLTTVHLAVMLVLTLVAVEVDLHTLALAQTLR